MTSEIERFKAWRERLLEEHKDEPEWQEEIIAFFLDLYRQTYPARSFPLLLELWDHQGGGEEEEHMASMKTLTEAIDLYILHGVPTGGFLEAVLSNDLREAMGRADEGSRANLFDLVRYLYNECPGGCWGSQERHREWMDMDYSERLRLVAASEFGSKRGVVAPVRSDEKETTDDSAEQD